MRNATDTPVPFRRTKTASCRSLMPLSIRVSCRQSSDCHSSSAASLVCTPLLSQTYPTSAMIPIPPSLFKLHSPSFHRTEQASATRLPSFLLLVVPRLALGTSLGVLGGRNPPKCFSEIGVRCWNKTPPSSEPNNTRPPGTSTHATTSTDIPTNKSVHRQSDLFS